MIGAVEIRLVAAGAIDAGARIIGHDATSWCPGRTRRRAHGSRSSSPDPGPARRRAKVYVLAPSTATNIEAGAVSPRSPIVDRHGVAGPVHEQSSRRLGAPAAAPRPDSGSSAGTARRSGCSRSRPAELLAVLFPEQLQGQMLVSLQLAMHFGEVQTGPRRRTVGTSGRVGNSSSFSRRSS